MNLWRVAADGSASFFIVAPTRDRVNAGRTLRPSSWPGAARAAPLSQPSHRCDLRRLGERDREGLEHLIDMALAHTISADAKAAARRSSQAPRRDKCLAAYLASA